MLTAHPEHVGDMPTERIEMLLLSSVSQTGFRGALLFDGTSLGHFREI